MADNKDKRSIYNRLHRIQGQINAIENMIDDDKSCEDLLIQINAAKSALHKLGQMVLEEHIKQSLAKGVKKGNAGDALDRFEKELDLFSRMG
ncbi:MAG TPA: metal-sensing transcriptional repressor [Candidatus Aphodousia gallistercoris]|nr:metal-sensing transcriptional repressor [Candidatus Aphodousia gallistercoris]